MSHFDLIHGGMIGGNCWKKVRQILENGGHTVLTPTLTGVAKENIFRIQILT